MERVLCRILLLASCALGAVQRNCYFAAGDVPVRTVRLTRSSFILSSFSSSSSQSAAGQRRQQLPPRHNKLMSRTGFCHAFRSLPLLATAKGNSDSSSVDDALRRQRCWIMSSPPFPSQSSRCVPSENVLASPAEDEDRAARLVLRLDGDGDGPHRRNNHRSPPFLAVVTEPHCCDTDHSLTLALKSLKRAVSTNLVDLVIVRVDDVNDNDSSNAPTGQGSRGHQGEEEDRERRIEALIRALVGWSYPGAASYSSSGKGSTTGPPTFLVAASSSLPQRLARLAHGVHAKESHYHHHHHHRDYSGSGRVQPPESVDPNDNDASELAVLGTSVHSVESALRAVWPNVSSTNNSTDSSLLEYLLVGTCFSTPSHPEKIRAEDLEGPRLPGRVRRALRAAAGSQEACLEPGKEQQQQQQHRRLPWVLGIGGIDARNCGQIIKEGADGVAVIRAVLASKDPASSVRKIRSEMLQATITTNLPDVK